MQIDSRLKYWVIAVGFMALVGCPTISPYDQRSYELATATKAQALAVLDNVASPYSAHASEVEALKLEVEKAYEYAKGQPKNEVVVGMWAEIRGYVYSFEKKEWQVNDNGNLYSTLNLWKREGVLNVGFLPEKKKQIAASFNQVIELESAKIKH